MDLAYLFGFSFVILKFVIIGYMIYCIATSGNVICRITAALVICAKAAQLLIMFKASKDFLVMAAYLSNLSLTAYAFFCIRLFIAASRARQQREDGAAYYYIIGISMALIVLTTIFSLGNAFPGDGGYGDVSWLHILYLWKWPHIALAVTFLVMRIKKVALDKDDNKLLWYFAIVSTIAIVFSFVI